MNDFHLAAAIRLVERRWEQAIEELKTSLFDLDAEQKSPLRARDTLLRLQEGGPASLVSTYPDLVEEQKNRKERQMIQCVFMGCKNPVEWEAFYQESPQKIQFLLCTPCLDGKWKGVEEKRKGIQARRIAIEGEPSPSQQPVQEPQVSGLPPKEPEVETVEAETLGEVRELEKIPSPVVPQENQGKDLCAGASLLVLTREEEAALSAPIDPATIDIRPDDGLIYWPWGNFVKLMNSVLGRQWALVPLTDSPQMDEKGNRVYWRFALKIRGHYITQGIGEARYIPNNPKYSWATAAESAKSDAIPRCCKFLGIASECWDPIFARRFRHEHCVQVPVRVWDRGKNEWQQKKAWRRKDAPPLDNEIVASQRQPQAQQLKPLKTTPQPERDADEDFGYSAQEWQNL
jgi:hypothetical protein